VSQNYQWRGCRATMTMHYVQLVGQLWHWLRKTTQQFMCKKIPSLYSYESHQELAMTRFRWLLFVNFYFYLNQATESTWRERQFIYKKYGYKHKNANRK